ncbi:MAG: hypothetical protein PHY28_04395 [Dehalococcoidales bacterium]|nr:hypothetical protein [Dehalococcoidales bacterium]
MPNSEWMLTPQEQFRALAKYPFEDLRWQKERDALCNAQAIKLLQYLKRQRPSQGRGSVYRYVQLFEAMLKQIQGV